MSLSSEVTDLLKGANAMGGYPMSLVCTGEGLLIAAAANGPEGAGVDEDELAGIVSLFDDIVLRAKRDLSFKDVDEVTVMDPSWGRFVIRPLILNADPRLFLVVRVPAKKTWRRNTNILRKHLIGKLEEMVEREGE